MRPGSLVAEMRSEEITKMPAPVSGTPIKMIHRGLGGLFNLNVDHRRADLTGQGGEVLGYHLGSRIAGGGDGSRHPGMGDESEED